MKTKEKVIQGVKTFFVIIALFILNKIIIVVIDNTISKNIVIIILDIAFFI